MLLTLLFTALLHSCEMIADVDVPEIPNRLVVYGVISPDSTIKVYVTHDVHALGPNKVESFDKANVTISTSNSRSYQGVYDEGVYRFEKNFIVSPLVRYNLTVEYEGYETVYAISEIPFEVPIESVNLDLTSNSSNVLGTNYSHYTAELTFTDPITPDNYYRVLAYVLVNGLDYDIDSVYDATLGEYVLDTLWENTKEIVHYEPVTYNYKTDVVVDPKPNWESYNHMTFNDDLFDGETYTLQLPIDSYYITNFILDYENEKMDTIMNFKALFVLGSISESLYDYYTTASIQQANAKDIFAEPIQVKSNIKNGFGVFGAENLSTYTIDLHRYD